MPKPASRPRCLALLATAFLVALALPVTAAHARTPARTRVVGGTPATAAQFPYLATVKSGGEFICGGSLIAPDRVLTAAHCAPDLSVGDEVVVGSSDARTIVHLAQEPRFTALAEIRRSPSDVLPYDVAVLQLNAPITDVAPIRLAQATDAALYAPGAALVTLGMGSTNRSGGGAGVLRYAPVQARSDADCTALLAPLSRADRFFVPATMLCTTDPDNMAPFSSGCFGDSGAPLVALAPDGTLVQVGVDDWGVACGFKHGDPESYVEVAAISAFALSPAPVFRPEPLGRPRFSGTVKVGRKVRCSTPKYNDPQPARIAHGFFKVTSTSARIVARGSSYRIPHKLRGHRLTCAVSAVSAGGDLLTGARRIKRVK